MNFLNTSPMLKKLISIQEASDISNKSIQTIRRAIKAKKLGYKRKRTPQGFNYLIDFDSLIDLYRLKISKANSTENLATTNENHPAKENAGMDVSNEDLKSFTKLLEKMIAQHNDERQNMLRLVSTLQEKIFALENQLNLLQMPAKKWYQLWK